MKSVLNIAKAELRYMATSPIAWGVSFILVLLFAKNYIGVLASYVSQAERGSLRDGWTWIITVYCPYAAWMKQPFLMISKFILPLLFMGVISREFSTGTMRLIQSSPIGIGTFVWGKFLGLMGYLVVLVSVYSLLVMVFCFSVIAPETNLLLWQLVVLLLYFFFIASICLFASSLSSYALVGGVVSIVLIIGTNLLNNVGQASGLGDFFYPLSHQEIGERLITGGIDWNDVVVLVIFTVLFVVLTIVNLQNKSRNLPEATRIMRLGLPIGTAFLLIAILPYTPICFTDIRRENAASVHPEMQHVLAQMDDGPLEVTHYFNIFFPPDGRQRFYVPEGRPGTKYNTWRPFMRHKRDIRVDVKYYFAIDTADYYTKQILRAYDGKSDQEIARIMADAYGYDLDKVMSLEDAQKEVDVKGNEYIGHIVKLEYNGRQSQVLGPGFQFPTDMHFHPAMERLLSGRGKELFFVRDGKPRELFYRTTESEYLTNKQHSLDVPSWQQVGPLQDSIWLQREELPDDASALIVAGPREPLTDTALQKIKRFIDEGGNLLVTGEPVYRDCVKPVLDYLGVRMIHDAVVQPTMDIGSARLLGAFTPEASHWSRSITSYEQNAKFFGLPVDTMNLLFDGASGLDVSDVHGFKVTPLIYSRAGKSWNKPSVSNYDSLQLLVDKQPTDQEGNFILMVLLHREVNGRQQRILVSGDTDFIKGYQAFGSTGQGGLGWIFNIDILTILTNDRFPVNLERPRLPDKGFRVTMRGVEKQEMLLVYALPALLIAGGAYSILRRRRK